MRKPVFLNIMSCMQMDVVAPEALREDLFDDSEDVDALFERAINNFDAENYIEAMMLYERAATFGHAEAMTNIGFMHDSGHGVPRNVLLAVSFYKRAADAGSCHAMFNLAMCYKLGAPDVPVNQTEALRWLVMAAEGDDVDALNELGDLYEIGLVGVSVNHGLACYYYNRAATTGSAEALYNIAKMYESGHHVVKLQGDGVSKIRQVMSFYRNALDAGFDDAKIDLQRLQKKVEFMVDLMLH